MKGHTMMSKIAQPSTTSLIPSIGSVASKLFTAKPRFATKSKKKTPTDLIGEIRVKPGQQQHMSLGVFPRNSPPKGFSVHVSPNPLDDEVVTQITNLDYNSLEYGLVVHVANYGLKPIRAEIWKI